MVGSGIFCLFRRVGRFRRSSSSKVDEFGANRKRICNFLLVRKQPWLYVAPVLSYNSFYVLLTPPLFNPNFGSVPVASDHPCWASRSAWALSYSAVKLFSKNSNLCDHGT